MRLRERMVCVPRAGHAGMCVECDERSGMAAGPHCCVLRCAAVVTAVRGGGLRLAVLRACRCVCRSVSAEQCDAVGCACARGRPNRVPDGELKRGASRALG